MHAWTNTNIHGYIQTFSYTSEGLHLPQATSTIKILLGSLFMKYRNHFNCQRGTSFKNNIRK